MSYTHLFGDSTNFMVIPGAPKKRLLEPTTPYPSPADGVSLDEQYRKAKEIIDSMKLEKYIEENPTTLKTPKKSKPEPVELPPNNSYTNIICGQIYAHGIYVGCSKECPGCHRCSGKYSPLSSMSSKK
jgi:hypothetical protein